jgi:Fe-S cluster assembly protein SufD
LQFLVEATDTNVLAQTRNLIIAETNSKATIIEKYRSIDSQHHTFTNAVTEIFVAPNAHLDHYKVQNEEKNASQINTTQVYQKSDSHFSNTTITLNGSLIRNNLNIALFGSNCEAYMNGLYMPNENMHVDNHTLADHQLPHSYSNELYKGILDGKATGVFNGKIYVRQDAQKTNAFQSNKNILLSETATVNTKPQLEIWADDVKCSHGCTVGAMDEEPLFYLRARGVPFNEARAMLMFAFAEDVLSRIKVEALRTYIERKIQQRLKVELD